MKLISVKLSRNYRNNRARDWTFSPIIKNGIFFRLDNIFNKVRAEYTIILKQLRRKSNTERIAHGRQLIEAVVFAKLFEHRQSTTRSRSFFWSARVNPGPGNRSDTVVIMGAAVTFSSRIINDIIVLYGPCDIFSA